jgi:hypothetical protein
LNVLGNWSLSIHSEALHFNDCTITLCVRVFTVLGETKYTSIYIDYIFESNRITLLLSQEMLGMMWCLYLTAWRYTCHWSIKWNASIHLTYSVTADQCINITRFQNISNLKYSRFNANSLKQNFQFS